MATLRGLAMPIGVIAAVLLVLLFNPWYVIDEGPIRVVLTVAFWLSFIILLIALFEDRNEPAADEMEIDGPRFVRFRRSGTGSWTSRSRPSRHQRRFRERWATHSAGRMAPDLVTRRLTPRA